MSTSSRRDALIGFLVCAGPMAAIAIWIGATAHTGEPPNSQSPPAQTQEAWSPSPLHTEPIASPYGPDRDCGDGTTGTFAECWARIKAEASQEVRDAAASRSAAARRYAAPTLWPTPTLTATTVARPPAVTICSDGSVSRSTGRGTCSWHGGIAP